MTLKSIQPSISVIGAGAWGSALALLLARNGIRVRLWGRDKELIATMSQYAENSKYLPNFRFPANLLVCQDLVECLDQNQDVLLAVPSTAFRSVLRQLKPIANHSLRIAWGTKGLDPETLKLLHIVVAEEFSTDTSMAIISGPSFATEVAAGKPTAVSVAGNQQSFVQEWIKRLSNPRFRAYYNDDMLGVELCGTLKNIMAIAVGIADGLDLGANARCALITRSLVEMTRLVVVMGGKAGTVMSLAGVGDLVLTCTDNQSRNRRFGLSVAQGVRPHEIMATLQQTVEGHENVQHIYQLAQRHQVAMPIIEQIYAVLYKNLSPQEALDQLFMRPLTTE